MDRAGRVAIDSLTFRRTSVLPWDFLIPNQAGPLKERDPFDPSVKSLTKLFFKGISNVLL